MRTDSLARDLAFSAAALALLLAVPFLTASPAITDFIVIVAANALLATSLNLLIGYSGLVSFGHAIYFASGAYAYGLLMQSGDFSVPAAFALAVLFTAVLAAAIGAICVRLSDIYFAFLTLAFQMLLHSVILSQVELTGGDQGLMGGVPRPPFLGVDLNEPYHLYAFVVVVFVASMLVMRLLVSSPFGYSLRMIRDNAARASFLGVNVIRTKLICFTISSAVASVGGIIFAIFFSGAFPEWAFWTKSGDAIFMIMLGGMQVFLGPLAGAAILHLLNDIVTAYTHHYGLVLGVIILIFALGLRRGLIDVVVDWLRERRAGGQRAERRKPAPETPA
jgi:branched-chain amino acid transport system permease protein